MNLRSVVVAASTAVAVVLAVLLLSPLMLLAVAGVLGLSEADWIRLSSIGQSYTGVSAILSAAALMGVVLSIRTQNKQVQLQQLHAVREMQGQVLKAIVDDPHLIRILSINDVDEAESLELRQSLHVNLLFRYLEFGYLAGEISEPELRWVLANEVFLPNALALEWWSERWRAGLSPTRRESAFKSIVDEEHALARERIAAASATA